MKKFGILSVLMMLVCTLFMTSCNSCKREAPPENITGLRGYDFDKVVIEDYDYVGSQYESFEFREATGVFDTTIDITGERTVVAIQTVFQVKDTCIIFVHDKGCYGQKPDVYYYNDYYMECQAMNARNAYNLQDCMNAIESYRPQLKTRYVTMRRILAPPFPENAQFIFGRGLLIFDCVSGEIEDSPSLTTVLIE